MAVEAFERGDARGFLGLANNLYGLALVAHNFMALKRRGIYEAALLHAFTGTRTNHHHESLETIRWLFDGAERERLRAAGDPLPGDGPFTLYRGVAGRGRARRVRGFSWSASAERAAFFARRFTVTGFPLTHPAVFTITAPADAVLAYVDDRQEQEFIVRVPDSVQPKPLPRAILENLLASLPSVT